MFTLVVVESNPSKAKAVIQVVMAEDDMQLISDVVERMIIIVTNKYKILSDVTLANTKTSDYRSERVISWDNGSVTQFVVQYLS